MLHVMRGDPLFSSGLSLKSSGSSQVVLCKELDLCFLYPLLPFHPPHWRLEAAPTRCQLHLVLGRSIIIGTKKMAVVGKEGRAEWKQGDDLAVQGFGEGKK